ncbi:alpha/beta hydrolase [Microtetraspora glauca]|uniref:Alpha/beta hydrolase family protein n=1 Tax=Microtetraspora glauca TaxID=1996 RepID=A0ABV3GTT0_MICGL
MKRTLTRLLSMLAALVLTAVALSGCGRGTVPGVRDGAARVTAREPGSGRAERLTIRSPALGRPANVWVLKPKGWTEGSTGWPVLYLLHGCCVSGGDDWLTYGEAERVTADLPAVVVLPEAGRMGWYADWRNGPAWETFHMKEVRGIVEPMYGVGDRRAVAGLSMGGHGAMGYAARHPGVFEAAASFSGVLDIRRDPDGFGRFLRDNGVEPRDIWGEPGASPDGWRAHNPTDLVGALKGTRLYVSGGDGRPGPLDGPGVAHDASEASILEQNRGFMAAAARAGVDVRTDFYGAGTHRWPYWTRALERALPLLLPPQG